MPAFNPDIEPAPLAAARSQSVRHKPRRIRRQPGIGVQEKKHLAERRLGTRVHLARPTARCREHPVGERRGPLRRAVAAAAVDDDDLVALSAKRLQRFERRADAGRFVEGRDDDGQSIHGRR